MKSFLNKFAVAAAISGLFATSAMAAPISFDMVWSGASFGNNASAYGTVVFDDAIILEQISESPASSLISLEINTSLGGRFDRDDYQFFRADYLKVLDLSKELIGQTVWLDCTFGESQARAVEVGNGEFYYCGDGYSGDFNFISENATTPHGTWYFELTNETGQKMLMTSLKKTGIGAVPEPASLALFGLALAGAAVARRKKA